MAKEEKPAANPEPKKSSMVEPNKGQKSSPEVPQPGASAPTETKAGEAEVMDVDEEKSREAIKAEREAKKRAKAAAKQGGNNKPDAGGAAPANDAAKAAQVEKPAEPVDEAAGGKSKAELKAERRAKQEAQRAAKEQQKQQAAAASAAGFTTALTNLTKLTVLNLYSWSFKYLIAVAAKFYYIKVLTSWIFWEPCRTFFK